MIYIKEVVRIKTLTLRLDDDLHQKLKLYSVQTKENMQDILVRLIKEELSKAENKKK